MSANITLIYLTENLQQIPDWSLGDVWASLPKPYDIHRLIDEKLNDSEAGAWLFWHHRFGTPDVDQINKIFLKSGQVWHAGLKVGIGGMPHILDFVKPNWMLLVDADIQIESSSWRLSLEACLIKIEVLKQLGNINPHFITLSAASLELGFRFIKWGVFTRYVPEMLPKILSKPDETLIIPLKDELLFIKVHFSRMQFLWTIFRILLSRYASFTKLFGALSKLLSATYNPAQTFKPFEHGAKSIGLQNNEALVSVLIPTIRRYSYLRILLRQLHDQSYPIHEVIVIDQTPETERDSNLDQDFSDLPLKVIYLDVAGQCTSRNAGLQIITGDYILFLDDDDEIEVNLIEKHLAVLEQYTASVSAGSAIEPTSGAIPYHFTYKRISDVFPTNNTLIKRHILEKTGLFDVAYNTGVRADGDLGIRIYLKGELMIYSPDIRVLHHHAPRGGLRTHKARVITYGKSRRHLLHRRLPHTTELYLQKRYYSERQLREFISLSTFGTFAYHGSLGAKILKVVISLFFLPTTLMRIAHRNRESTEMFTEYPQIPRLVENQIADDPIAI